MLFLEFPNVQWEAGPLAIKLNLIEIELKPFTLEFNYSFLFDLTEALLNLLIYLIFFKTASYVPARWGTGSNTRFQIFKGKFG